MKEDTTLPEKKIDLTAQEKLFRQQLEALPPIDNDTAKKIAQMIAGKIPDVGGVVSALIGIFWPTTEVSLWDQIKEQVEKMIDQKIAEYNLQQLRGDLISIRKNISDYNQLKDKATKITKIIAIDAIITDKITKFVHGKPESAFSTFWGLALLHLTVRRELYNLQKDDDNKALLANSVALYCTFARVALSRIYNERINTVSVTAGFENEPGKNTILHIDVDMRHSNGNLYAFHRTYRGREWDDNTIRERKSAFNTELPRTWDNMVNGTKSDLGNWAFEAIKLMEAEFPYTAAKGLLEVESVMEPDDYKKFAEEYYPNESVYNNPVTTKTITRTKDTRPKPL